MIHQELCKKFEFDHMNKCCIYNPESLVENEIYTILWDFEIQTDQLISVRQPKSTKNENLPNSGLSRSD